LTLISLVFPQAIHRFGVKVDSTKKYGHLHLFPNIRNSSKWTKYTHGRFLPILCGQQLMQLMLIHTVTRTFKLWKKRDADRQQTMRLPEANIFTISHWRKQHRPKPICGKHCV